MASVGQKNTGAELLLRTALHRLGLRYKLHEKSLPGSPDLVFPRFHAVVFVHGCYWHSHGCYRTTIPKTRRAFWIKKFKTNKIRDAQKRKFLIEQGWRVLTVWECALTGKYARPVAEVACATQKWLKSRATIAELQVDCRTGERIVERDAWLRTLHPIEDLAL
jgi:DNA mismatch endonuclease (patch repair protein)